ncbi:hypothetical protein HK101_007927 [Irineochytrium annulatum]|nr:hypothetical protein HK101_007927 [Irineochytrium annulatum]
MKDSKNKALNAVVAMPDSEYLQLSGFTETDCLQMIEWRLKNLRLHIQSVNPKITAAVYAKTGGNPLFLQLTLEVLIAKIGSDLQISDDGKLEMAVAGASADDMLSDLSAAVLFQFDRLNPTFQQILKAASILGQYFVLTDVLDILGLDWSNEKALELIRDSDTYSFLLLPKPELKAEKTEHLLVGDSFNDNTPDVPTEVGSVCLAFRHIGIMNAVYDSLAYEERIEMNTFFAGVLENLLCDENQDTLLPSIEFHYSRTGEVEKIIHYREMLG